MSKRYWTADWHLNHDNILRYTDRPFKSAGHMAERLIANANMRAGPDDLLIHVGDFMCYGSAMGVRGAKVPWYDYVNKLSAQVTLLRGNHDPNNKVKTAGSYLFCVVAGLPAVATHLPTGNENHDPGLLDYIRRRCKFAIVGHVHGLWRTMTYSDGFVDVNVGVDANRLNPVSDDEVANLYRNALAGRRSKNKTPDKKEPENERDPGEDQGRADSDSAADDPVSGRRPVSDGRVPVRNDGGGLDRPDAR